MYEDSQRFSEEEGDESSHVVSFHPRSTATYGRDYGRYEVELVDTMTNAMQRGVDGDMSPSFVGVDHTMETPTYDELHTNIREESIQRILSRLSPNGQKAFLQTLSEGGNDVIPPEPFSVPETDEEDVHSEMGEHRDAQSEINYLLDSPIPELTTRSLIPPPEGNSIQSQSLMRKHPNITVRTKKTNTESYTEFMGVGRRLGDEQPHHSHINKPAMEYSHDYVSPPRQDIRIKPYIPSELERTRVTKNLFPEICGKERHRNTVSTEHVTAYEAKTKDPCTSTAGSTHVVWSDRGVYPTTNEAARFRPIPSTRIVSSSTTYPKLLAGVEIFNSVRSPTNLDHDMSYAARTGAGYSTTSPGETIKYQYFEPISTESREIPITERMGGGVLYTGHGIFSDQRHADPLLGGGMRGSNFSRTQCEIAHPTGTPKFCGNSGAVCERSSLNRGNDYTHAPARLSAT